MLVVNSFIASYAVAGSVADEQEFKGVIAKQYEASTEWWPKPVTAPIDAPNVLVVVLDDVGYAQIGSFGGLIATPNIDALAEKGLRFSNFHTTALCSPSRAALLAGRNHHSVGLGSHSLTAMGFPGYNAVVPANAKSFAKTLEKSGYINYAIGKWDHTPLHEVTVLGPFDRWPSGEGFHHFYGFMAADTHNFQPQMYADHRPIEPWRLPNGKADKDYHLSADMADQAIGFITQHKSIAAEKPFMMLWAPGTAHAPHHAPKSYIENYKGLFDLGWDQARIEIFRRQREMGVIPSNTQLTERPSYISAWASLTEEERRLYARQMEVFAAMVTHTDDQIGKIVTTLKRIGQFENTLIIVTSDNGASDEGGSTGMSNEAYIFNGRQPTVADNLEHFEQWGGPNSYPHYHSGWAMAGNTPFRYAKKAVHRGGMQDPLIISWPKGIAAQGELRTQYHHIIDIAPTILQAANIATLDSVDGIAQKPLDGLAMNYSFDNAVESSPRNIQYYELYGNRGIYVDGWKAVTLHAGKLGLGMKTNFDDDIWELYHVEEDFSEANDLALQHPEKLTELKALWEQEAWRYNVFPLYDDVLKRSSKRTESLFGGQTQFSYYYPGATRIAETVAAPIKSIDHVIKTNIDLTGNERGVIVAEGGVEGGFSWYIEKRRLHYDYRWVDGSFYRLRSKKLPKGKTDLAFRYEKTGMISGEGHLLVGGEVVDSVEMPQVAFGKFSLSETFDVGTDTGTTVTGIERHGEQFRGTLDRVDIEILSD